MPALKFLIDNMCAKFTVDSVYDLVRTALTERVRPDPAKRDEGPCTVSDIASKITESDRSLDIKSAQDLAEAAVADLAQRGDIVVQGAYIYPAQGH